MARVLACAAVTLAALGAPVACRAPQDPILVLLADLERAAEARDADAIHARLADDFEAARGVRRAEARALLQRYFLAYETVALEVYEVQVQREESTARLSFRVDFNGRPLRIGSLGGLLPPSAMYRFDLDLRQMGKGWQVAAAAWEELRPAGE